VVNRTRQISKAKTVAKAEWEADNCRKHHGYRLKGKAGSKRPIPMNSVKPLAARFNRLKSGHAPVGRYLNWFGHKDDEKCWLCGWWPSRGNIFSATAADGKTNRKYSGKRCEK
jgi:hypothetical protein